MIFQYQKKLNIFYLDQIHLNLLVYIFLNKIFILEFIFLIKFIFFQYFSKLPFKKTALYFFRLKFSLNGPAGITYHYQPNFLLKQMNLNHN